MINGSHFLLYSRDPEADRSFFRDVLDFRSVNAGGGWLIFALPAAEAAIHPLDEQSSRRNEGQDMLEGALYLMCEDLDAMIESLRMKNVECTPESALGKCDPDSAAKRRRDRTLPADASYRA
jgi:hypothetical protein